MRFLIFVIAAAAFTGVQSSTFAVPLIEKGPTGSIHKVQECGWFAIYSCSRSWRDARNAASAEGGLVLDSSSPDFPNFRPGYYCAAFGSTSRERAMSIKNRLRYSYPDAYVKSSC